MVKDKSPRYKVRVLDNRFRPVTTWQWCPDPDIQPLSGKGGAALIFDVPTMTAVAKGWVESIEVQLDGKIIFTMPVNGIGKIRKGDILNIDNLQLTVESN